MRGEHFNELSRDELTQKLKEFREALFNLRFQHATGQLENTAQLKKTKKNIARVLTALNRASEPSAS